MIQLSQEMEALAVRLAAVQRVPVEAAIQRALENEARVTGIVPPGGARRRMTVEQMLALGGEIAAMPVRDSRPPSQIMDELNGQ